MAIRAASATPSLTRRRSILIFSLATLAYWAALYVYVPVLPVYAESMGASLALVGLVVSAYGLGQLVLRVPVGVISDRLGRRKPFCVAGVLAASLGSLIMLLAPSPGWLIVGRGVAGIAAAAWVTITVLFAESVGTEQLPRAMAFLTFLSGAAQLASTTSGGWIADAFGWSAPFALTVGLGVIGGALFLVVPEGPNTARRALGWIEVVRVATRPRLLHVALVGTLLQFTSWATTYAFVPIFARDLGASRTDLGLLTGLPLVPYTLAALAAARWATHASPRRMAIGGLTLMAASAAVVPFVHGLGLLLVTQAFGGLGRGLAMPALLGLSISDVGSAEKATAMGVFQAVYALGMFLGPATAGVIADELGLGPAFVASGILCLLAAALLAARRP